MSISSTPHSEYPTVYLRVRPVTIRFTEPGINDLSLNLTCLSSFSTPPSPPSSSSSSSSIPFSSSSSSIDSSLLTSTFQDQTVSQLLDSICILYPNFQRLRLIYSGRILHHSIRLLSFFDSIPSLSSSDSVTSEEVTTLDDLLIQHSSSSFPTKGKSKPIVIYLIKSIALHSVYLHCSVGDSVSSSQQPQPQPQPSPPPPSIEPISSSLRGFDRLQESGFSSNEIQSIRSQFHSIPLPPSSQQVQDQDDDLLSIEDQWFESPPLHPPTITTSFSTLVKGLMVGYFFPFIPLFFLHPIVHPSSFPINQQSDQQQQQDDDDFDDFQNEQSHVSRNIVFSKQMQIAVLFGTISNLLIAVIKMMW